MTLTPAFWISFAIGAFLAAAIAFRYSHSGSHPRFRPNPGLVGIVFAVLLVVNVFLALLVAKIIGQPSPPEVSGKIQSKETNATPTTNPPSQDLALPEPAKSPEQEKP